MTIGDVLCLDRDVVLELAITALTLAGAIFAGLLSFVIDRHDTNRGSRRPRSARSCSTRSSITRTPPGVSLAAERREPLVDLVRRYGFVTLEDVAYRDLGFEGDPLPSPWSLARDVVALAGTTSKTFFLGSSAGGCHSATRCGETDDRPIFERTRTEAAEEYIRGAGSMNS